MNVNVQNTPFEISVEGDIVMVDGPQGVAVSMTPAAAAETADRLLAGASQAQGHQVESRRFEEEKRLNGVG